MNHHMCIWYYVLMDLFNVRPSPLTKFIYTDFEVAYNALYVGMVCVNIHIVNLFWSSHSPFYYMLITEHDATIVLIFVLQGGM